MSGARWPDLAELAPHAGPMRLLSEVVAYEPGRTVCSVDVASSRVFRDAAGAVPAWVALEWMAQCIAVHAGLRARQRGETPRPGLFLGARRARLHVDSFAADERLRVSSRHVRGERGLVWFDCAVEDESGATLAQGRLSVYPLETTGRGGGDDDGA